MLKNYLTIACRTLLKNKGYSLINLFGLSVGIVATILILIYIQFEFSYDRFHKNGDRIYRVSVIHKKEGKLQYDSPVFTPPLAPAMAREFPEVENFVRLSTPRSVYASYGDKTLRIQNIVHADSALFALFSFRLLTGDPGRALVEPYSIILTDETARRLFGSENPLGQTILLDNRDQYRITGIVENPPANSHIRFNALVSFATFYRDPNRYMDWNGGNQYYAYVQLRQGASREMVEARFPDFMWRHINEDYANYGLSLEPYLQPLNKIHLFYNEFSDSALTNIYVFSATAVLILLIACINFVNLTTARATRRAKEVGVRKVLGADKSSLIKQFLGESILLTTLAVALALLLVELALPVYRQVLDENLQLSGTLQFEFLWILLAIVMLVGVFAGSYPALYLSSFQAARTLKGEYHSAGRSRFRQSLVVLQFAISIALIVCTLLIHNQLRFVKAKELGFTKENIVVLPLVGEEIKARSGTLKQRLSGLPGVKSIAATSEVPYNGFTSNGYIPEGFEKPVMIHVVDVDEDFFRTFDVQVSRGRGFSPEFSTDKTAYMVNEALVKSLGWENPLGKFIKRSGEHQVIGVVADFHFASMYAEIAPLIITSRAWRDRYNYLAVRIASSDISSLLHSIEETWQSFAPGTPFDYWFLDQAFDELYKSEERFRLIFVCFSILAISIALLGLFSLAAFSTEQRTKEIGIRKVLGASVPGVLAMLSKEFLGMVLLANLLAWPVAWFAMERWLQNFAYRIDIGYGLFLLAGAMALLVALATVGSQAVKAAVSNPLDALRYE